MSARGFRLDRAVERIAGAVANAPVWIAIAVLAASPFVVGALFGVACHVTNRLRAMTPIPSDHAVFTEGPFVLPARGAGR